MFSRLLLTFPLSLVPAYPLGQTSPAPIARDKEAELLLGASRTEMNAAATDPSLTVGTVAVCETKNLVSELCQQFYALGWVSGTGGSVAIKVHDETTAKSQQLIVASPSGLYFSSTMSI